jgi:hypothetical protein
MDFDNVEKGSVRAHSCPCLAEAEDRTVYRLWRKLSKVIIANAESRYLEKFLKNLIVD